jgi:hypothetical protein
MIFFFMILEGLFFGIWVGTVSLLFFPLVDLLFLVLYRGVIGTEVPGKNIFIKSILRNTMFLLTDSIGAIVIYSYFKITSYSPTGSSLSVPAVIFCIWALVTFSHAIIIFFGLSKHYRTDEIYAIWHISSNLLIKPGLLTTAVYAGLTNPKWWHFLELL